jgi:hypothetical protein
MLPVEAECLQKPSGFRSLFPDDAGALALGAGRPTSPDRLVLYFKETFSW